MRDRRQGSDPQCLLCCISGKNGHGTVTKLKNPTALEMRNLKRPLRHVKGPEDMSTVFEVRDNKDKREQLVKILEVCTVCDWASEQTKRKSTSGAVVMAEGKRLHAHSRGQSSVALRSCESEVMAASEGIKEALLLQDKRC